MGQDRRSLTAFLLIGGVALALCTSLAWALWPSKPTGVADPTDATQVALGMEVYLQHCASCHGVNLEGQPNWRIRKLNGRLPAPPHDETGHTWHHPDEHLFKATKLGFNPPLVSEEYQSDMPGFADVLTDAEIWATLAYIKSRWPEKILRRHAAAAAAR